MALILLRQIVLCSKRVALNLIFLGLVKVIVSTTFNRPVILILWWGMPHHWRFVPSLIILISILIIRGRGIVMIIVIIRILIWTHSIMILKLIWSRCIIIEVMLFIRGTATHTSTKILIVRVL